MAFGARVEQDFAQQAVVLAEYALGNLQVPLGAMPRWRLKVVPGAS